MTQRPRIYCDYNAAAPVRPEARTAALAAMAGGANPSSVHGPGRDQRRILEAARETLAQLVGARAGDVVFTSGGTEAANLALTAAAAAGLGRVLVSALEHDAVLAPAQALGVRGLIVETIPATADGRIDLAALERLAAAGPALACVMAVQNETGVIQPVAEAARIVQAAGGFIFVDAVQALGRVAIDVESWRADYLALSAHKVGAIAGAGALVARGGSPLAAHQIGGGQERGLRAGTQNVVGQAAFAAAAEAAVGEMADLGRIAALRDRFEARVRAASPLLSVQGAGAVRVANTSNIALAGFPAATQVMAMDLAGVAVSAGAACTSGKVKTSRALMAMGLDEALAGAAIRVSFGWASGPEDADIAADAWIEAARRAAKLAPSAAA